MHIIEIYRKYLHKKAANERYRIRLYNERINEANKQEQVNQLAIAEQKRLVKDTRVVAVKSEEWTHTSSYGSKLVIKIHTVFKIDGHGNRYIEWINMIPGHKHKVLTKNKYVDIIKLWNAGANYDDILTYEEAKLNPITIPKK